MTRLTFDPELHAYYLDGRRVARSVTGVLKASGLIDFSHVPPSILEAARTRGTVVHRAVHYFNEHDLDVAEFERTFPDYAGYLHGWLSFCARRQFAPILCEHRIVSRFYDMGGTIDCLGVLDGHGVILDFATGSPAETHKSLQLAAYLMAAREWAPEDPDLAAFLDAHPFVARYGVALRGDGSFRLEHYADASDTRQFRVLVEAQCIVTARRRRPLAEVA